MAYSRWERESRVLHHYERDRSGSRPFDRFWVCSASLKTNTGNVWIGFNGDGGLVRYRDQDSSGSESNEGHPPRRDSESDLRDAHGRLWAAKLIVAGLIRIDRPSDERPEGPQAILDRAGAVE